MRTNDLTLRAFLEQHQISKKTTVWPREAISSLLGCEGAEAADCEALDFELSRPFDKRQLLSFAAAYLIQTGYKKVTVSEIEYPAAQVTKDNPTAETHQVVGEDPDLPGVMITLGSSETLAQFLLRPYGE